jgi:putative endopeptidase
MSSNAIQKIISLNKTKKNNYKMTKSQLNVLQRNPSSICNKSLKPYNTFEDKAEELFKKNNMDIVSTSFNLEKDILKNLKTAVSPSGIQPNDDFYSYINERWISDYQLSENQKYIVQVDDFRIVQDKVYRELIDVIEEYTSNPKTKNSKKAKCIKDSYLSFRNQNTDEQINCLANDVLNYIDTLRQNKENIWQMIATINQNEIISWGCPFVWTINPDDKDPTKYKCYLEQPQLTLIDVDIYFEDDEDTEKDKAYKRKYKTKYFDYLNTLFTNVFGENHGFNVKDVFNTEVEIINAVSCDLIKEEDEDGYNLITKDEALKDFGFDWDTFCKFLGFEKVPNDFVTSNVNYLLCGTKLLKERWDSPEWRTYFIYIYIRQQSRFNERGLKNFYEFNGAFVRGQEQIIDPYIRPVFLMGFLFNTFFTNEYITRNNNIQAINYVKTMAEDLKSVFIRIIKRNNWLQPKTKEKALEKLKQFKLTIGSPEILSEDPLLDYKSDDPWGNLVKMSRWRHLQAINLVGKKKIDIPVIDWSQTPPKFISTQAYVVNASYTPSENGIYIPLGYIQKPFIDLDERGLEYNLSRIGFTIAHEMSHALDDLGSKYDETGKLNNWWTDKDKKIFEKIQKDVIKQYEVFASNDGIEFDAEPSIGEDLADISGLAICQEYLRDFQFKNQDILPIQSLSFEVFFVFFAIQSRQKISKKAVLAQLKTNPHPLDKYRCNVPLSRTKVFRAIYNVEKGDKMWWHSTNNVWNN